VDQAVKTGDKRLEVLSGPFDGRHGWQLLNNPAGWAVHLGRGQGGGVPHRTWG
jgi:hypothetical protein